MKKPFIMNTISFPAFGTAAIPADPFEDAAEVVRNKVHQLNALFHTGNETVDVTIDTTALQASVALEAMRDLAAAMPPNHKRDLAHERISELSSQLSRRMEKLAQDRKKYLTPQEQYANTAHYAASQGHPIPVMGNHTVH